MHNVAVKSKDGVGTAYLDDTRIARWNYNSRLALICDRQALLGLLESYPGPDGRRALAHYDLIAKQAKSAGYAVAIVDLKSLAEEKEVSAA